MNWKLIVLLILIVTLAIFLRVFRLSEVPVALFGDEIDVGYQAYSILETGKDMMGRAMPFYIRSIAEFRAPLYIYSAVPFVWVFGLNEWGVRLPAAFWGVVGILGLFLLVSKTVNRRVGVISAVFLAISPWHLHYSRASFEVTMLLAFMIFGVYFFILGRERKWFYSLSTALLGLSFYIYNTSTLIIPVIFLILVFYFKRELLKSYKWFLISLGVLLITLTPFLYSVIIGEARERFSLVSIFQETVLLDKINLSRKGQEYFLVEGEKQILKPFGESIFHNKLTVFSQVLTLNYLRAFSFDFLFAKGDSNLRHNTGEMGVMYFFDLALILIGLWRLVSWRGVARVVLFGWLLFAPIPAALTIDGGYHATRLILMLPPLIVLSALGFDYLIEKRKVWYWKVAIMFTIVMALVNVSFYLHRYYLHYPFESWRFWHVGFKEAMTYVDTIDEKYQIVVINNSYEPSLVRYLFYTKYNPNLFHENYRGDIAQSKVLEGVRGFKFGNKHYFGIVEHGGGSNEIEKVMKPGMLYLASARDELNNERIENREFGSFRVLKTIYDPIGSPIFYVLEGK